MVGGNLYGLVEQECHVLLSGYRNAQGIGTVAHYLEANAQLELMLWSMPDMWVQEIWHEPLLLVSSAVRAFRLNWRVVDQEG